MSKILKFSIDYLIGQNAPERKDESSFSKDGSSSAQEDEPSPIFSEDGCTFVDGLLSVDKKPTSLDHHETDGRFHAKPPHSYINLVSMAILSTEDGKMLLSEIYSYIIDKFPYYNNKKKSWKNSIRHNLSLNECFIKHGMAENGKGNFWSIHPACVHAFTQGDFRRRQARHRARTGTPTRNVGFTRNSLGYVPMTPVIIQAGLQPTPTPTRCYQAYMSPATTVAVAQRWYYPFTHNPLMALRPLPPTSPYPGAATSTELRTLHKWNDQNGGQM